MPSLDLPALAVRARAVVSPNATLLEREDLTAEVAVFRITVDGGAPPFRPGQYFALGLPLDGALLQRPYSAAAAWRTVSPLEFLIRRVPTGAFTPRLWALAPGARLHVGRPKGLFTPDPDDHRDHLLLATGTGIGPLLAILDDFAGRATAPRVLLMHGVAQVDELAYRQRLEAQTGPGFAYHPVVSRPWLPANAGWAGATGRLDAHLARAFGALELRPATTVAYVCGNPQMIATVTAALRRVGLDPADIRFEEYWPAARDMVA